MNWLLMLAALACGAVLTTQVATNKQLGEHLHNLYLPAVANMVFGMVAAVSLTLAFTREWPTTAMVKDAPWYSWFAGGVLGAVYLTGNILLAPRLGAATLIGLVVTGQIVFSVLIDQFGWFGFAQHSANLPRLIGCALLIGGVALVAKS
jgi:transporter family-2 protein